MRVHSWKQQRLTLRRRQSEREREREGEREREREKDVRLADEGAIMEAAGAGVEKKAE